MINEDRNISASVNVSPSVIRRLPRYYWILKEQLNLGELKISSSRLAKLAGTTASQIRQDFSSFGGFGLQGYGYSTEVLINRITEIIGIPKSHKAILVGVGNMGKAIATHLDFVSSGFTLMGLFDKDESIIGSQINDIKVRDISELTSFCKINNVHTAIICVPKEAAYEIVGTLYNANVYNFWNFSHYDIKMDYPDANVENVRLRDSLMCLCYHVTNN